MSDDCDSVSEIVDWDLLGVVSINDNLSFLDFYDPTEGVSHGALSSSRSSNDTNFLTGFDLEREVLKDQVSSWSVSQVHIFELNLSFLAKVRYLGVFATVSHDLLDTLKCGEASLNLLHLLFLMEEHPGRMDIPVVELELVL